MARELTARGWQVLEQRLRTRWAEVDVLARSGDKLAIFEVKSGTRAAAGHTQFDPKEHFTPRQQARLRRALVGLAPHFAGALELRLEQVSVIWLPHARPSLKWRLLWRGQAGRRRAAL